MSAKKRASPGADEEKNQFEVEISDETLEKLKGLSTDMARVELALDRAAYPKYRAAYERRREIVKSIPKFWSVALMNDSRVGTHVQYPDDRKALMYLEDVWVQRHEDEPRVTTISFTFAENPYFEDKVLVKDYKYTPPAAASDDKPDENGITLAMLDFDPDRDVQPQATTISWKEGQNLIEKHPRVGEGEDMEEEGSFFHYFTTASDPFEFGQVLSNEIFPEAIDFFTGQATQLDDFEDSDEEDEEEEDDEDEEEIDLEKPRAKKAKQA